MAAILKIRGYMIIHSMSYSWPTVMCDFSLAILDFTPKYYNLQSEIVLTDSWAIKMYD